MEKKPFNKQEIFTKVKTHLLKQGVRAMNEDEECQYRGENETKCAVGCLIPDKNYNKKIEGDSVDSGTVQKCIPYKIDSIEDEDFLCKLQYIHDQHLPEKWGLALVTFAQDHNLEYQL